MRYPVDFDDELRWRNERGEIIGISFHGTLQQLLGKVERGEMVPRLQASHAPPCKFWTAFQGINGIRHMTPVIHGGRMQDRRAPTCGELIEARSECSRVVPQFRCCEQCSADVVRFPAAVCVI